MSGGVAAGPRPFFCREWALDRLRRCLEVRPGPARPPGLLVLGGPGAGKTALCARVLRDPGLRGRCLAAHFCRPEEIRTTVAWRFVLDLVEQLRTSSCLHHSYRDALGTPEVAPLLRTLDCQRDPGLTFSRAVLRPLLDLPPPAQPLMLLVDGLDVGFGPDEGSGSGGSIAELLAANRELLPDWLLLVCSARRHSRTITRMFSGFRRLCLDDLRKAPAVRDVQRYILSRLDREAALRRQLTPDTADMLNLLHIKSGGCFLFLERVLDGVAGALVGLREIRDIPGTLNGLYLWLCQRLFPRRLFLRVRPLLDVLLAAPRPLHLRELFAAVWTTDTSLSVQDFQKTLRTLSPLLVEGPAGTRLLFHASFAEWLTDVKYCTRRFLCSRARGHVALAMSLTLRAPHLDAEDICQLAVHLVRSGHHGDRPSLLAVWMLWTGVPALAADGGAALAASLLELPAPVGRKVRELLETGGPVPGADPSGLDLGFGGHRLGEEGGAPSGRFQKEPVHRPLNSGAILKNFGSAENRTLLTDAAVEGSADATRRLLAGGFDPLAGDRRGQTPLTEASRRGHAAVLKELLDWAEGRGPEAAGRMMEQVDREGWTALRSAAWGGHGEAVRLLLDAGADVDGCDGEGRTALRAAAWGGHQEVVLTLLEFGARVDKADRKGRTPLIAAAYMGHHEAVEILLDHDAEVDLADGDGRTALSVAAICPPTEAGVQGYGEVASLLLERGADPARRDHDGMTPLLLAAYEGHEDIVELLLEAGADVDEAAGPAGGVPAAAAVTPLLAAAAMGHVRTVARLLFWGAAVDAIDCEGRTALCLAASRGSGEVVRALLDRGLDENHKDDLGWTPLHAAACEGHRAVCAALTERGSTARVGEMDVEGRTPLILAAQEGHLSTVRLLLDRRSPVDHRAYDGHAALSAALLHGHADVAELLLRRGADTDVRDADGRPLLYLLVLEGRQEMAALLMEKGGCPLESRDSEGRTALHVASWQGSVEMMDLLLKRGADPNARDAEGRPPLHSVAWTGNADAGRRLLATGGLGLDLACHQGATALSIAAQEGHADIVSMLLQAHANPDHVDKYGRSPMKVAGKNGHFDIVRLLESFGAKAQPGPPPRSTPSCSARPRDVLRKSDGGEVPAATSSSSFSSPGSTAERLGSAQSSRTSSTCHSLATVQTVPADSLSFIQQIRQHSLPRGRPSALPGSIQRPPRGSPPASACAAAAAVHGGEASCGREPRETGNPERSPRSGGKWNSVMASLGIVPGQDGPPEAAEPEDGPPTGYPYKLQGPRFGSDPPPSEASRGDVTKTTDPQLNLKQAIKLQFEGPTCVAFYKRETPL